MSEKVYVVGFSGEIEKMFVRKKWAISNILDEADIVVFPGGNDINPALYDQTALSSTIVSKSQDERDLQMFRRSSKHQLLVGICRGAQFLNVMSGGKLWQHVDNHTRSHEIVDFALGYEKPFTVTSTHHQMMRIGPDGEMLAAARNVASIFKDDTYTVGTKRNSEWDPEVAWYPTTRCLCFQPHPEFGKGSTEDYFFDLIDHVL